MTDEAGGGGLEHRTAALRLAAEDRERFLELLAGRLETLLPGLVRVERRGIFGNRPVRRLTVRLPDAALVLAPSGAGLAGERHSIVHDIVVRRDAVPLDAWVDELAAAVDQHAAASAPGAGLARLLELD